MTRLEAYSDHDDPPQRETCECGQWRARWAEACERCLFLDGNRESQLKVRIIEALRVSDMTASEICVVLGRNPAKYKSCVFRCLQSLEAQGRASKYESFTDTRTGMIRGRYGGMINAADGGQMCWKYTLDCPKKRRV